MAYVIRGFTTYRIYSLHFAHTVLGPPTGTQVSLKIKSFGRFNHQGNHKITNIKRVSSKGYSFFFVVELPIYH